MDTEQTLDSDSGHNGEIESLIESPTLDTVSGFSSCSAPSPQEPFQPQFSLRFTGDVAKDGDVVKYTIRVVTNMKEYIIMRQYEDFEWLEHCLTTSNSIHGLIVPPLPPKPPITSEMAEAKSKKQLGNNTRTLMADDFQRDCRQLEEYLRLLVAHDIFGRDQILERFLTELEPPARSKVKRGLLSRLSDSIESRKGAHKDCEEFFQIEREWVTKYGAYIKDASQFCDAMIFSQQRLCGILGHLATALNLSVGSNEGINKLGLKLNSIFSEGLENYKHQLEVESYNQERNLSFYFELYSHYIDAEKDMLFRRTCLLVDYENANKSLDKAKPNRREIAEQTKLAAEKTFEECSDTARQEIKRFHKLRVQSFGQTIEKFAEAQARNALDTYALLSHSLSTLQQFVLPEYEELC